MNVVDIHEDDEGMRNLYPAKSAEAVFSEMDKAVAAAEKNRSASGLGWDDVHMIQHPKPTFSDSGLTLNACLSALEKAMPRISRFTVGGSPNNPFYSDDENPFCFGYGNELYLKLEVVNDLVSHIWYDAQCYDPEKLKGLRHAFVALDEIMPCVLADYWMHADGYLSNTKFLDEYFAALATQVVV